MTRRMRRRAVVLALATIAALAFAVPARAAGSVIHVTTPKDVVTNDGRCSLREAVNAANSNAASGARKGECVAGSSSASDTIILHKKTTYVLSLDASDEDANAAGDLDGTSNFNLVGSTATRIKQTTRSRVLDVQAGVVTVSRVIITGGHPPDG